jgi:hypothetical protein
MKYADGRPWAREHAPSSIEERARRPSRVQTKDTPTVKARPPIMSNGEDIDPIDDGNGRITRPNNVNDRRFIAQETAVLTDYKRRH